jgi:hypothetical protein
MLLAEKIFCFIIFFYILLFFFIANIFNRHYNEYLLNQDIQMIRFLDNYEEFCGKILNPNNIFTT